MHLEQILIVAIAFALPIGFAMVLVVWLGRVAKRSGDQWARGGRNTLPGSLRWPVLVYGALFSLYFVSLSVREWDYEVLRNRNWALFENWLIALATLLTFYVGYLFAVAAIRYAAIKANRDPLEFLFVRKITGAVLFALAIVTTLNLLGYNVGPVLASLGVAGIAVALAAQETLANYFASLSLTMDKSLKPGDYIRLDSGQEGFVEAIGWRTTRIRPYGETMLIVPNTKLTTSIVTNFYLPENSVRVYIDFGVAYEENLQEVEEILVQAARHVVSWVEGADREFEPIVRFKEFAESNVAGTLIVRAVDFERSFFLKHEIIKAIHRRFSERGIRINYPVRQILPMPVDVVPKYPPPDSAKDVI